MNRNIVENHCEVKDETGPCFASLTEQEKELLRNNSTEIEYNRGEIIAKQGTKANNILYLTEGLVKIGIRNGENYLILSIKPLNHFIATETLWGTDYHPYTITALEDSVVHFVDNSVFKQVMKQNPNFSAQLFGVVNSNMVTIYNRMFSLTQKQLHGRLADILLCLSNRIFKNVDFDLPLSRKDLAALTGMAPESVIRILKDFKNDKLIETKGKHIKILNVDMLQKISAVG